MSKYWVLFVSVVFFAPSAAYAAAGQGIIDHHKRTFEAASDGIVAALFLPDEQQEAEMDHWCPLLVRSAGFIVAHADEFSDGLVDEAREVMDIVVAVYIRNGEEMGPEFYMQLGWEHGLPKLKVPQVERRVAAYRQRFGGALESGQ